MITNELLVSYFALLVAILSFCISVYFNKRTLEQSDANLKTQLLYDDQKKSIFKLNDIIDTSKTYNKFCENIKIFLDSNEGQFISNEIRTDISIGMRDLDKYDLENDPSRPPELDDDEEYQRYLKDQEEIDQSMNPYEIFEQKFGNKLVMFKSKIKNKSRQNLEVFK